MAKMFYPVHPGGLEWERVEMDEDLVAGLKERRSCVVSRLVVAVGAESVAEVDVVGEVKELKDVHYCCLNE